MSENTQVKAYFRKALSGELTRREIFQQGARLGVSPNVIGMLAIASSLSTPAPTSPSGEEGDR